MATNDIVKKHLEDFIKCSGNKNVQRVFARIPTLMVFIGVEEDVQSRVKHDTHSALSNPDAAIFISSEEGDVCEKTREACGSFIENADKFGGTGEMNVFVVVKAELFKKDEFDRICAAAGSRAGGSGTLRVYTVCLLNELETDREKLAKMAESVSELAKYAESRGVFVLGRKRMGGKILSGERCSQYYAELLAGLMINIDRMAISCGAYAIGSARIDWAAASCFMELLGKSNDANLRLPEENGGNSASKAWGAMEGVIQSGYINGASPLMLSKLIVNKEKINSDMTIEEYVKLIYGMSLDVYLEYEEKKAKSAAKNVIADLSGKIKFMPLEEQKSIRSMIKGMQGERYANFGASELVRSFEAAEPEMLKDRVFEKYVLPGIEKIKSQYRKKVADEIYALLEKEIGIKEERAEKSLKAIQDVRDVVTNFRNTNTVIETGAEAVVFDENGNEDYKEALCEAVSVQSGRLFEKFFDENTETICEMTKDKAVPYCRLNKFDTNTIRYVFVSSDKGQALLRADNSMKQIEAGYLEWDAVTDCSSLDLNKLAEQIKKGGI